MTNRKVEELTFKPPITLKELKPLMRWKILSYAMTGGGKTYFMGTMPGMSTGEALIIDTDGSLDGLPMSAIEGDPLVYSFRKGQIIHEDKAKRVNVFDEIVRIIQRLVEDPLAYGRPILTLGIDGVTMLSDFLLSECMLNPRIGDKVREPNSNKATFDEYGALGHRLDTIFTMIDALPCHVCVTAGATMDKDDTTGIIRGMPDVIGSFRQRCGHRFSAVLYLHDTDGVHMANTCTISRFRAKVRRGYTGPKVVKNPTFESIFNQGNFKAKVIVRNYVKDITGEEVK